MKSRRSYFKSLNVKLTGDNKENWRNVTYRFSINIKSKERISLVKNGKIVSNDKEIDKILHLITTYNSMLYIYNIHIYIYIYIYICIRNKKLRIKSNIITNTSYQKPLGIVCRINNSFKHYKLLVIVVHYMNLKWYR